jgi:hypothetical protein
MEMIYNAIAVFNECDLNVKGIYFWENIELEKVEKKFENIKKHYQIKEKKNPKKIISLVKIENKTGEINILETYKSFGISETIIFSDEKIFGDKIKILKSDKEYFSIEKRDIDKFFSNLIKKNKTEKIHMFRKKYEIKIRKFDIRNAGHKKNNYISNKKIK